MGPTTPKPAQPPATRCPRCRGLDIVPSMPRSFWDEVMRGFGRVPKHCRGCGKRFFVLDRMRVAGRDGSH